MSLPDFAKAMDRILTGNDLDTVKREGMKLITTELGAGVPGYIPYLERFAKRLEELAPKRGPKSVEEAL